MTKVKQSRSAQTVLRFLQGCSPSRLAFLAGSGISVPSGLPTAFDIGAALADAATANRHQAKLLRCHLSPIKTVNGLRVAIRFERLLQIVRETADKRLSILKCLGEASAPTELHHFLATILARGASVFTTNFDSLIEYAYLIQSPNGSLRVLDHERSTRYSKSSSFAHARNVHPSQKNHLLFKLHGSLHEFGSTTGTGIGRWRIATVNATLDTIGRDSVQPQLEVSKERVFNSCLNGRILIVLGYSGLDDFDIVPALERTIQKRLLKGILWISHRHSGKISVSPWSKKGRRNAVVVPQALINVAKRKGIRAYVAYGDTAAIIRLLFSFRRRILVPVTGPVTVPRSVGPHFFMTHKPYNRLSTANYRLIAGRLCESAGDFSHADAFYRQSIAKFRFGANRESLRTRGLATSRRGYIKWLRGKNNQALVQMRSALRLLKRAHDSKGIAAVTNQIGLVFLNQGRLKHALHQFRLALVLHRKRRDRTSAAKSLANIGIVYRRMGDYPNAEVHAKKALSLSTSVRDREGMARDLGNLGNAYLGQRRFRLALKTHEHAFRLAEQIGQKQIMAVQCGNVGVCYRRLQIPTKAIESHRKALLLNREIGRVEGIHDAISEMGAVFGDQRLFSKSIRYLTRAALLAKKQRDVEGLAEDLESRGNCFMEYGMRSRARRDWRRSSALFSKLKNHLRAKTLQLKL